MHIQLISTILGWFGTTLGIVTTGAVVAGGAKVALGASVAAKAAIAAKAAAAAKVALAAKAAAAAKTAAAAKAAAAVTKAAHWSHLSTSKFMLAKIAAHNTTVEVGGVATGAGLIWRSGAMPMIPSEQVQVMINAIKNTPNAIYGLYQSIPPEVFEFMFNVGNISYGASGVYDGCKQMFTDNQNVPNTPNVPDDDNSPLFPVMTEIINNLDIAKEELSERLKKLHSYLLSLMYITNYEPDQDDGYRCSICLEDNPENVFITQCRHVFCYECLINHLCNEVIKLDRVPRCPNCRTDMPRSQELPANIQNFVAPDMPVPDPVPDPVPIPV